MSDVADIKSSYVITSTTNHPIQRKTTSAEVGYKLKHYEILHYILYYLEWQWTPQ